MASPSRQRAGMARWHTVSQALAAVVRSPGLTRADLVRELELASGFATELMARMRELHLITELPAPTRGRGRPTTIIAPHPDGPVVLALDLGQDGWGHAVTGLDGHLNDRHRHPHRDRRPGPVLAAIRDTVHQAHHRYGHRLQAVSLAVAGTLHDQHLVQASTLGWGPVDLGVVTAGTPLTLLTGNDATLAGVAEARTGAATTATTALHLIVEVGIGGTLTIDGRPITGAHGAAGEYGHLPFGDPGLRCPCGAHGCWDLTVDGRALARHLGTPEPADPRAYARCVLQRAAHDADAARAAAAVAQRLAAGIAGLVNLHDPDLITLGGLGPAIRHTAGDTFIEAYTDGLMQFRRSQPPPVVDAHHRDDGPLHGAAITGLDHVTTEMAVAHWARLQA